MSGNKILRISGKAVVLRGDDIDTDRIIPARFLKEITFSNLGKYPFYDERFNADLTLKDHPFNDPQNQDGEILFVNKNFGCGSSREHAPQSLFRWGIKAIAGESFAEIFASNCLTLGIPVLRISESDMREAQELAQSNRDSIWVADVENNALSTDNFSVAANMPEQSRRALLHGLWNSTDLLLENMDKVRQLSQQLPYISNYSN